MDTTESSEFDGDSAVSNMNVEADEVTDRGESLEAGLNLASLYERTVHNCNILHACAGSDGVEVEDDKSGFVGYVGKLLIGSN